ncbi:MAG: hypothetical protein OSB41_13400, partial [Kiritimatiellae bacterium]|nr:hypothetical protein [Kiritimatiellia bacterium]
MNKHTQGFRWAVYGVFIALMITVSRAAKVDYEKDIWPVVRDRCLNCHKAPYTDDKGRLKKPKAGLRFDTPEWMMKGSEDGEVIIPGKPDDSTFYTLVILPPDDDDVMPAKGDPVTKEEAERIRKWIEEGADFGGFTGKNVSMAPQKGHAKKGVSVYDTLNKGLKPADAGDIAAIKESGALVMPLAQKSNLLRVDYGQASAEVGDAHVKALAVLKNHIVELNLAGSKISDAGLKDVAALEKLTRLHLENTAVGDAGVAALTGLEHLAYLNLYGTKVTDASVKTLGEIKSLTKLYIWQTEITDDAVAGLVAAKPALMVSRGWARENGKVSDEAIVAKFFKDKCCDKAHKRGAACSRTCCKKAVAAGNICEACNTEDKPDPKLVALAKNFTKDKCCDKAFKEGKACDHDCCIAAAKKDEVCTKCNPSAKVEAAPEKVAAPAVDPKLAELAKAFSKDSCCDKAFKGGKACDHGCCVKAAAKGEVCTKCNAAAKVEAAPEKAAAPAVDPKLAELAKAFSK